MYHLELADVSNRGPSMESIQQQMAGSMNVSDHDDHNDQRHHEHHQYGSSSNQPSHHGRGTPSSSQSMPQEEQKKQNHSEIEKRRREKMNSCIKELASIIPVCSGMSRKLDKLTVLRMAVQHLKTIRGSMNAFTPGSQAKPSFLSNKKLYDLILKVRNLLIFVVTTSLT